MKYSFVFVCQQGELETKSMLLAASLKRNIKCEHQLIAAIPFPETRWGRVDKNTMRFFDKIGVECMPIVNLIDEDYPIGNKVSCLNLEVRGDITIFLDSDMLCLRPFADASEFTAPFCAKPADGNNFANKFSGGDPWERVYSIFDLNVPDERMVATITKEVMRPYFNAGFIAVHSNIGFGEAWLACCRAIDSCDDIKNKRPWLDQIALPVAVRLLGINYACLEDKFNYPCHRKRLDPNNLPIFAHYHRLESLSKERILLDHCLDIVEDHPELRIPLQNYFGWNGAMSLYHPFRFFSSIRMALQKASSQHLFSFPGKKRTIT